MRLVDSHCHLDDEQFEADREAVIQRARDAGVEQMLAIGAGKGPPDLEAGVRLAERYEFIWATVGVHPHDAAKAGEETFQRLEKLLGHPKVVAVGEIGLDYHYDFSPRERQREVFARQLEVGAGAGLPVIIHTREAWEDTLELLQSIWKPTGLGGVMHCFSGGPEEARRALDLGFHLSFSGTVTFPRAAAAQEAARMCPADRLLVETDCPYLAPVPKRGKRNEPAFVVYTAARVAELRGQTLEEVAQATTENFRKLCLLRKNATK